jgi:hypothetical protein
VKAKSALYVAVLSMKMFQSFESLILPLTDMRDSAMMVQVSDVMR